MSDNTILIDVDHVTAVLLGGIWHEVTWRNEHSTFRVAEYDYIQGTRGVHLGAGEENPVGYEFLGVGGLYAGPVSAIQAVRTRRD